MKKGSPVSPVARWLARITVLAVTQTGSLRKARHRLGVALHHPLDISSPSGCFPVGRGSIGGCFGFCLPGVSIA
jgi:hypothetical protein